MPAGIVGAARLQRLAPLGGGAADGAVFRGEERGHRLAEHFRLAPAQHGGGACVPQGDPAVRVGGDDAVVYRAVQDLPVERLALVKLAFRPDPLDMRPGTFGDLADHAQLVVGPVVRLAVVDRHQRDQAAFLDQRHADRGGYAYVLERPRFVRGQFAAVVGDDQRAVGIEFAHRESAEVGQPVMPHDRGRTGGVPVSAYGEAVAVLVHVGIGAVRHAEMLGGHVRGDGQDLVGAAAIAHGPAEIVEEAQARLAFLQGDTRGVGFRGLHDHRDHACRGAVVP